MPTTITRSRRAGWHTLKGGVGFQRTVNDINSRYPGGFVYIFWDRTLALGGQPNDRGAYGYYEVNDRGTVGEAGANILSLYVQDQWQIGDRLTLNLGIRTEAEKVPSFRPEIQETAIDFGFGDKIAPRLGFAYDLHGRWPREAVSRVTGGTTIGRSTSWLAARSEAISGASSTEPSTIRTIHSMRTSPAPPAATSGREAVIAAIAASRASTTSTLP